MERRKFTQLLGLTGLGLLSNNFIFGGSFAAFEPEQQDFILACGIHADPISIQPRGNHLRWCLPPAKGFPDSITIYRKTTAKEPILPILTPTAENRNFLKLNCDDKDPKAWKVIGTIDNNNDFKDAQKMFSRLSESRLANAFLPASPQVDRARALNYYKNIASKYVLIAQALKDPESKYFKLPENTLIGKIPINELEFKSNDHNKTAIKPWNLLNLASIDPNIAIMLGCYFVDEDLPNGNDYFDYKIEALYKNTNSLICGIVRQISNEYSLLPTLSENLVATQIGNTNWNPNTDNSTMKQTANVRLSWKEPEIDNNSLRNRYTDPVIYTLHNGVTPARRILPTRDNPHLIFTDRELPIKSINYQLNGIDIFGQKSNPLKNTCLIKDRSVPAAPVRLCFIDTGTTLQLQFEYGGSQYLQAPNIKRFQVYQRNDTITESLKASFTLQPEITQVESGETEFSIQVESTNNLSDFEYIHFVESPSQHKLRASARKKFRIKSISGNKIYFTCSILNYTPPQNGWVLLSKSFGTKSAAWKNARSINFKPPIIGSIANAAAYTHFISGSTDHTHFAGSTINASKSFNCRAAASKIVEDSDLFEPVDGQSNTSYTEIFLNRSVSVADVFSKGSVKIYNSVYPIAFQSAGIAAPANIQSILANDPNKSNSYARILVKNSPTIEANTPVQLIPPIVSSSSTSTSNLDGYVVLVTNFPANAVLPTSGEILLNGISDTLVGGKAEETDKPIIARICSDFYPSGSSKEVLVHLDKKIKKINTATPILCFAPYRININTLIKDPALPLLPNSAYKSAYFAVEAINTATPENAGPFSSIAQFIKTRSSTAKPPTPGPPFPCSNQHALEAFLTIPNKEGRSTFCIAWTDIKNAQGASLGYRYEIGRALDKTIISVHRDLWLKGKDYDGSDPDTLVTVSSLSIVDTNPVTGLISIQFNASQTKNWKLYEGGRLKQTTSATGTRGFEITRITAIGNSLTAMLRPMIKGTVPVNSPFSIDVLPNYAEILLNTETVKRLSNICESAFSVVTGQPIRNATQFLDDVPGTGSSRFFYKVRTVDGSENRSDWSPASVAVWQTDITPPEPVKDLSIEYGYRTLRIIWRNIQSFKPSTSFEVFRSELPSSNPDFSLQEIIAIVNFQAADVKKLYLYNNKIELPSPLTLAIPEDGSTIESKITTLLSAPNIIIHTPNNPTVNLYSTTSFDIDYEIIDNQNAIKIKRFIAKEPVSIGKDQELVVKIGATIIKNDTSFLQFVDKNITPGKEYNYAIRCFNKIQNIGIVRGQLSAMINGVKIVSPTPITPIVTQKSWINTNNAVVTTPDANSSFRFTVQGVLPIYKYRILRRKQGLQMWGDPVINDVSSWQPWGNQSKKTFTDKAAQGTNWEYGIQFTTIDQCLSEMTIFSTQ